MDRKFAELLDKGLNMLDMTEDMETTARGKKLKEQYFSYTPSIYLESALAKTEVYRETKGEEEVVRRAKAFLRTFERKTATIHPDELIIRNVGRTGRCAAANGYCLR